jgi:hypothetical protein
LKYWKDKLTDHFNKIILTLILFAVGWTCVHLMHKADAGGDDAMFIQWAEGIALIVLTKLLALMPTEPALPQSNTTSETRLTVASTTTDPNTDQKAKETT